jgi:hypothetical protein
VMQMHVAKGITSILENEADKRINADYKRLCGFLETVKKSV